MSLREQAAQDAAGIVQNMDDFGWPVTVITPGGQSAPLKGLSNDIGLTIDPETGQAISGRRASVVLPVAELVAALGPDLPRGVAQTSEKPWLVRFDNVQGQTQTFKVAQTMHDRTVGLLTCLLEAYRA